MDAAEGRGLSLCQSKRAFAGLAIEEKNTSTALEATLLRLLIKRTTPPTPSPRIPPHPHTCHTTILRYSSARIPKPESECVQRESPESTEKASVSSDKVRRAKLNVHFHAIKLRRTRVASAAPGSMRGAMLVPSARRRALDVTTLRRHHVKTPTEKDAKAVTSWCYAHSVTRYNATDLIIYRVISRLAIIAN
nr:hypothetical protein Iba_chr11eCG12770 [Ipomoea batatas]